MGFTVSIQGKGSLPISRADMRGYPDLSTAVSKAEKRLADYPEAKRVTVSEAGKRVAIIARDSSGAIKKTLLR